MDRHVLRSVWVRSLESGFPLGHLNLLGHPGQEPGILEERGTLEEPGTPEELGTPEARTQHCIPCA